MLSARCASPDTHGLFPLPSALQCFRSSLSSSGAGVTREILSLKGSLINWFFGSATRQGRSRRPPPGSLQQSLRRSRPISSLCSASRESRHDQQYQEPTPLQLVVNQTASRPAYWPTEHESFAVNGWHQGLPTIWDNPRAIFTILTNAQADAVPEKPNMELSCPAESPTAKPSDGSADGPYTNQRCTQGDSFSDLLHESRC